VSTLKIHSNMLRGLQQAAKALAKDVFLVGDGVLKEEARGKYKILLRSCIPGKKAGSLSEVKLLRDGVVQWGLWSQNPESGSDFAKIPGLVWFMLPDPGHPGWLKYSNFLMVVSCVEGIREVKVYRKPIGCKTFAGCVEVDLSLVEAYG